MGACECTGVVSPILGGGHGFLQGQYGLLADNLLSADLVLANGTMITISESQHSDLFWGLRGAGQNFGIVTKFRYRIYDRTREKEMWAFEHFIFPTEKLEAVYEVVEEQRTEAPVELAHWGLVLPVPDVDPSKVSSHSTQDGTRAHRYPSSTPWSSPFSINPLPSPRSTLHPSTPSPH